jgi:hypothetical protein
MGKTVASLICMISFACLVFQSVVSADATWDIQIVDENAAGYGNGYCPIVVDSNNTIHIAYTGRTLSYSFFYIRYVNGNGSDWSRQETRDGIVCDLKVDSKGNVHVLYTAGNLIYAVWTGSNWTSQTITEDQVVYASLALDSSENLHAAYSTGDELKYANYNGSNWTIQTVDTLPEINLVTSLALDSNDTPYILYSSPSSYVNNITGKEYRSTDIKLAVWKNSSWSIEPVLDSLNLTSVGNLVLDSKGYPHFIATRGRFASPPEDMTFLSTILYVSWDGADWNIQTVASSVNLGRIGFLALGPYDYPQMCYLTHYAEELVYVRWTGTAWDSQIVDTESLYDKPCYLAVDSNGNPHISYSRRSPLTPTLAHMMYATTTVPYPTPPPLNLSIVSPENTTYFTNEIALTFTTSKQASSMSYSLDGETNVSITGNTTLTGLSDGAHSIVVYAKDTDGNTAASEAVNFSVDTPPNVSLLSPQNTTYNSTSITLNFTVNQPAKQLSYSLDGQNNVTITGNTTITDLPNGPHNLTIYATDETNNTKATETIHFTITKENNTSAFTDSTLLLVSATIITATAIIVVVYVWKKRH